MFPKSTRRLINYRPSITTFTYKLKWKKENLAKSLATLSISVLIIRLSHDWHVWKHVRLHGLTRLNPCSRGVSMTQRVKPCDTTWFPRAMSLNTRLLRVICVAFDADKHELYRVLHDTWACGTWNFSYRVKAIW